MGEAVKDPPTAIDLAKLPDPPSGKSGTTERVLALAQAQIAAEVNQPPPPAGFGNFIE